MDAEGKQPREMSDREIRREARASMERIVTNVVETRLRRGTHVSADADHSDLLRLTLLRAEARRRARLN
jgi:hypothetical protein